MVRALVQKSRGLQKKGEGCGENEQGDVVLWVEQGRHVWSAHAWVVEVVSVWRTLCCVWESEATCRWLAKQCLGTGRVNCHWVAAEWYQEDDHRVSSEDPGASAHAQTPWQWHLPEEMGLSWTGCTCRQIQRGSFIGDCTNGVARWFGCIRDISTVREDLLEVRSTGYLSGKHQTSSEEVVSTVTSVRGARYDVGSARFSNKSALSGPCPVPTL